MPAIIAEETWSAGEQEDTVAICRRWGKLVDRYRANGTSAVLQEQLVGFQIGVAGGSLRSTPATRNAKVVLGCVLTA